MSVWRYNEEKQTIEIDLGFFAFNFDPDKSRDLRRFRTPKTRMNCEAQVILEHWKRLGFPNLIGGINFSYPDGTNNTIYATVSLREGIPKDQAEHAQMYQFTVVLNIPKDIIAYRLAFLWHLYTDELITYEEFKHILFLSTEEINEEFLATLVAEDFITEAELVVIKEKLYGPALPVAPEEIDESRIDAEFVSKETALRNFGFWSMQPSENLAAVHDSYDTIPRRSV